MKKIGLFYDHVNVLAREEKCSIQDALRFVREQGIELLEISQNNLVGREDEVCRELAWAGLGVSAVPAYFDFGRNDDIVRQCQPTLEAARFIGADKLLVIPGFLGEDDPPEERERQTLAMAEGINRLADMASGYGITLVMEDFDSQMAPFSTIDGVAGFLNRCPALSCCFDTGNFLFMGEDALAAYQRLKDRIAHVHLKDRSLSPILGDSPKTAVNGKTLYPCPVGAGEIPMEELLDRLARDGYSGDVILEFYGASPMKKAVEESVNWVLDARN